MDLDEQGVVAAVQWAVVSSAPEATLSNSAIMDFFGWFLPKLNEVGQERGIILEQKPETVNIQPAEETLGSKEWMWQAYREIRRDFPNVLVVFHILPGPNCPEHDWMQEVSWEVGVIRQGLQLENVKSRFQSAPVSLDLVLNNIQDWILKSIHKICRGFKNKHRTTLMVTLDKSHPGSGDGPHRLRQVVSNSFWNFADMQRAVNLVLHGVQGGTPEPDPTQGAFRYGKDTDVSIQGLPSSFPSADLSALFKGFRVVVSKWEDPLWRVRLGSKWEAFQAAEMLNGVPVGEAEIKVQLFDVQLEQELRRPLQPPLFHRQGHQKGLQVI